MLKKITLLITAMTVLFMFSCRKEEKDDAEMPAITIWEVKASSYGVEFKLTPTNAVYYRYAVTETPAPASPDFTTVESTVTGTFSVNGLTPEEDYVIIAEAVNADGVPVRAEHEFKSTSAPSATIENITAYYNRITFDVVPTNCVKIYYAIGTQGGQEPDFDTFSNVETTEKVSLSVDGLLPETGYTLYVYPENAEGELGEKVTYDISTSKNIVIVEVISVEEQSREATLRLSLTGVSELYYCYTEEGSAAPTEDDYVMKAIENDASETEITFTGLSIGHKYTAYLYGKNEYSSGQTVQQNFEAVDNSINLSENATANSYICQDLAEYRFNATVKGNSDESIGTPVSVSVVWSTVADMFSSVYIDVPYVRFSLKAHGNALLAVSDENGKILWSWHIYSPEEPVTDDRYVNYYESTYYVMDRNFGAMKADSGNDCILYQWGRKDPFPNKHTAYKNGTGSTVTFIEEWLPVEYTQAGSSNEDIIEFSIANPATFITSSTNASPNYQSWTSTPDMSLWGDQMGYQATYQTGDWSAAKTIYDPCPPGYRVANLNTVSGFTTTGANSSAPEEFNVINSDWGNGETGYWIFRRYPGDTEGTYWPNTATRNPATGKVERGTQAEHWFIQTTGRDAIKARYSQIYGTRVFNKTSSCPPAYGHAIRCVRYKSETETMSSDYSPAL